MIVRAGILCIPAHDDDTIDSVSQLLRSVLPDLFVVETGGGSSQLHWVEEMLRRWCDEEELDLIVTTGGTFPAVGPSAEQIVPEATSNVIERLLPGFSEAMRAYAQDETPLALLDRGVAGIRGRTLILNLPNGPSAATLFLEAVVEQLSPVLACLNDEMPTPQIEDDIENNLMADEDVEDEWAEDEAADWQDEASDDDVVSDDDVEPTATRKGLDPQEFAEYLAKRQADS